MQKLEVGQQVKCTKSAYGRFTQGIFYEVGEVAQDGKAIRVKDDSGLYTWCRPSRFEAPLVRLSSPWEQALAAIRPLSVRVVAFIKVGHDDYDGAELFAIQFYLFTELQETGRFKQADLMNVLGLSPEQFQTLTF